MRGVASAEDGNHSGPLPSVRAYLDELPITTISAARFDIHVYDVARIEALAGPQGTLYGASSESGTLRIITNKPEIGHFSAAYDVQVNDVAHGGLGRCVGEGYVNLPINDKMARCVSSACWTSTTRLHRRHPVQGSRSFPTAGSTVSNNASSSSRTNFNAVDTIGGRAADEDRPRRQLDDHAGANRWPYNLRLGYSATTPTSTGDPGGGSPSAPD